MAASSAELPSASCPIEENLADALLEKKVGTAFFARDALRVARGLIGMYLVHLPPGETKRSERLRVVRIVETEAYRGPTDSACHARVGLTNRTRTLLGPPGFAYVFLVYGMYDCFNVVCKKDGAGHAVLIRAGEPIFGVPEGVRTDGPGKLTRAMGISRSHDAIHLEGDEIFISAQLGPRKSRPKIRATPRIGVAYAGVIADAPWRFVDSESRFVSKPQPKSIGSGSFSRAK